MITLSPKQLDAQSPVRIARWLDIASEECQMLDDNHQLSKKWLKMGLQEPAFLFVDTRGYVWGQGKEGLYYPFHFEGPNNKLIGYRIATRAAN